MPSPNPSSRIPPASQSFLRPAKVSFRVNSPNFTGPFEGPETPSPPVPMDKMTRRDRLISEAMAYLEEYRWRVAHSDNDYGEVAKRLGIGLATLFRNFADQSYFGKVNRKRSTDYGLD